jgi:hypothetical protein
MGNLIGGVVGFGLLAVFVGGLAISIGAMPFFVITVIVLAMALVDVVQSIRAEKK